MQKIVDVSYSHIIISIFFISGESSMSKSYILTLATNIRYFYLS